MSEPTSEIPLTFPNFNLVYADPRDIYDIGATLGGTGVLPEMAEAFGYVLAPEPNEANLRGLVEAIGQAGNSQDNSTGLQTRLGRDEDAVARAQDWVSRTGLLEPVSRSYIHPGIGLPDDQQYVAMMTDGLANAMDRRAQTLVSLYRRTGYAAPALLVAGNGLMDVAENPKKVREGMTRADYMRDYIQPYLARSRIVATVVVPNTEIDDEVMEGAVAALDWIGHRGAVVVASNAGDWPRNGGQMRRAIIRADVDNHLYVTTEQEVAPETGAAPARVHQNPLSALEQIAHNHLELYRNIPLRTP